MEGSKPHRTRPNLDLRERNIMTTLINKDENGIIWIENNTGDVFGIFSHDQVLDADGLKFDKDTLTVLNLNGIDLEQDHENETTFIDLGCDGRIEFCMGGVAMKEAK